MNSPRTVWVMDSFPSAKAVKRLFTHVFPKPSFTFFTCDPSKRREWEGFFEEHYLKPTDLPVVGVLDEEADTLKYSYIDFLDSLRQHSAFLDRQGKPILLESSIAYWWLHEGSTHNGRTFNAFVSFLHLSLLQKYVVKHFITDIVVISRSHDFVDSIQHSFRTCKIHVVDLELFFRKIRRRFIAIEQLLRQIGWALRSFFSVVLLKLFVPSSLKKRGKHIGWGFYSLFPHLWKGSELKSDDKYKELFSEKEGKNGACYLFSIISDGYHQKMPAHRLLRLIFLHRPLLASHIVLDQFVRIQELFFFLKQVIYLILKGNLISRKLRLIRAATVNNLDLTSFIVAQNNTSILRLPRALLEGTKVKRCLEHLHVTNFVYYLYEFILGRTILYRTRTSHKILGKTKIIGMQHAPVNDRILYNIHKPSVLNYRLDQEFISHMPHPDELWVEDHVAKETLLRTGYPEQSITIIGSRRMLLTSDLLRESPRNFLSIVVYPTIAEETELFYATLNFMKKIPFGCRFSFKPHPRSPSAVAKLDSLIKLHKLSDTRLINTTMLNALRKTDIALGTDSSALEEALNCGKHVGLILMANKYNQSILYQDPGIRKISTAEDLTIFVNEVLRGKTPKRILHHESPHFGHTLR